VQPWKVLAKKVVLDRRWLSISEERVALPNGTIIDEFHVLHTPDWAGVIALTDDGQVVMVEQYRHGLGHTSLELPAGVVDAGETPLVAAQRELREETGYVAQSWHALIDVAPEPARSTHRAHFFVATGARPDGPSRPEPSEVIAIKPCSVRALLDDIEQGRMDHAAHIGAILLADRRGFFGPAR
jgi:8-oxo-dGTP pyrophosphatase MutT (NUDIX family)